MLSASPALSRSCSDQHPRPQTTTCASLTRYNSNSSNFARSPVHVSTQSPSRDSPPPHPQRKDRQATEAARSRIRRVRAHAAGSQTAAPGPRFSRPSTAEKCLNRLPDTATENGLTRSSPSCRRLLPADYFPAWAVPALPLPHTRRESAARRLPRKTSLPARSPAA